MGDFLWNFANFAANLFSGLVEENAAAVSQFALLVALFVVVTIRATYMSNLDAIDVGPQEQSDGSPKRSGLTDRQNQLRRRGFRRYQSNVQELLNGMASFVGDAHDPPQEVFDGEPGDGSVKSVKFSNWSAQSYLFAIGLATLYPLLLMLAMWAATGEGGVFGSLVVVADAPDADHTNAIIFEVLAVTIMITLLWYSFPISRGETYAQWIFASFAAATLLLLIVYPKSPWFALLPAFVGALFAQGPLAAAMAWSTSLVAVFLMFFGALWWVVVPLALAVPFVTVLAYRRVHVIDRQLLPRLSLVAVAIGASLLCAAYFARLLTDGSNQKSYIDFGLNLHGAVALLCVLPVANAFSDWVSLSITRYLMGLLVSLRQVWWLYDWARAAALFVLDLAAAFGLSLLVTFLTIVLLQWFLQMAPTGGEAAMNVEALVKGLRQNPFDETNIWVYAMLYSTLVPTVAHFIVVIYSVAQTVPLVDFKGLAERLDTEWHHTDRRRAMARELTFLHVADDIISAIVFAIAIVLFIRFPLLWAGDAVLSVAELAARASN